MRTLALAVLASGWLLVSVASAQAEVFSVTADVPLVYNLKDSSGVDVKAPSGFLLGLNTPFLLGLGYEQYKVPIEIQSVPVSKADLNFTFYDLLLNVPFPVINLGLGYGIGTGEVKIKDATTDPYKKANMSQYFVTVGIPFALLFDVHVGYHVLSGKAKENIAGAGEADLESSLYTVGLRVGF
jgi:hypothetical protein